MPTTSPVNVEVANPPAPVSYAAAGINALTVNFESVLSMMKRSKVRRLTHEDQISRHPTDEAFRFADDIGRGQWLFWTKSFLKRQR
jgi:hypothetical protein